MMRDHPLMKARLWWQRRRRSAVEQTGIQGKEGLRDAEEGHRGGYRVRHMILCRSEVEGGGRALWDCVVCMNPLTIS